MKYTINNFNTEFPDDRTCLEYIFKKKYPKLKGFHRISTRLCYSDSKGNQIYPLKGTIFENSSTSLKTWFFALYLFSQSKHGVSASELERQTGVTYKTAWRMCNRIRSLMKQGTHKMFGTVEADETYIGATKSLGCWSKPHVPVVGMVQRNKEVRAKVIPHKNEQAIVSFVEKNLRKESTLYSDGAPVYNIPQGYKRGKVIHTLKEYVRGDVHTNSVEGFWSQLKRSIRGTHAAVSRKYLQMYVDERVFTWNYREDVFLELLRRI